MEREDWLDKIIGTLLLEELGLNDKLTWRQYLMIYNPFVGTLFSIWLVRGIFRYLRNDRLKES